MKLHFFKQLFADSDLFFFFVSSARYGDPVNMIL